MNLLPKIDFTLRTFDTRGSSLLSLCLVSAPIWVFLWLGIRKTFPIGECLQARAKAEKKSGLLQTEDSLTTFCRTPSTDHVQAEQHKKNSLEFPITSLMLRHRNYIQLVEKETNLSSRLVCSCYQQILVFPSIRTTTDFWGATHNYFTQCNSLAIFH